MSRVEFEESQHQVKRNDAPTGIIGFLIRNGLVKSRGQAVYALLGIAIVCLLISMYLINDIEETDIPEEKIFDPATAAPDVDQIHPNR